MSRVSSGSPLTDSVGANKKIRKDSGSCPARLAVLHEDLAGEEERVLRRPRDLDRRIKPSHTVRPRTFTVDKTPAYPSASKSMKKAGELSRLARLRQVKYLTDVFDRHCHVAIGLAVSDLRP